MISLAVNRCMLGFAVLLFGGWNAGCLAEPVRITHNHPFPPLSELRNGKSEGLLIDVVRAASVRVGLEIEFVGVPVEQMELTLSFYSTTQVLPFCGCALASGSA